MASDPPVLEVLLGAQPVSESTEDAHSNAWALPTPDLNTAAHAAFFKTANGAMKHIHAHYGSPYNYLKEELKLGCGTPSDIAESLNLRNDFAHWMWTTFPEKEDQSYHHHGLIPSVKESDMAEIPPLCVHTTSLGYDLSASLKPPPGQHTADQLIERYLLDGVVTVSEPGWIVQPSELAHMSLSPLPGPSDQGYVVGQLAVASLGYVKFWARVCTLLGFLRWLQTHSEYDLATLNPKLHDSIRTIYVYHVPQDSKVDEAIVNLRKSCQGAIRRAPNTITILLMIHNLFA